MALAGPLGALWGHGGAVGVVGHDLELLWLSRSKTVLPLPRFRLGGRKRAPPRDAIRTSLWRRDLGISRDSVFMQFVHPPRHPGPIRIDCTCAVCGSLGLGIESEADLQ